jgi:hypothetical protein
MRKTGSSENSLIKLLSEEPAFKEAGITEAMLGEVLRDKAHFLGNAGKQIDAVKAKAGRLLERYPVEAAYEPRDIL